MAKSLVEGFVVEADERGFFYTRTGEWVKYKSPAKAYVWSEEEVAAIQDAAKTSKVAWPLTPTYIHAAIYDDSTGATIVTEVGKPLSAVTMKRGAGVSIPDKGGIPQDIQASLVSLGAAQMIASGVSL